MSLPRAVCWAWRRATTAARSTGGVDDGDTPPAGGVRGSAVSWPVDTAARTEVRGSVEGSVSRGVGWGLGRPRPCSRTLVLMCGSVGEFVRLCERCLGRCFPCFQFREFRLHPKDYHPLLGCFSVDLGLNKSLFVTEGGGNNVRSWRSPAFGDVPFFLLSR